MLVTRPRERSRARAGQRSLLTVRGHEPEQRANAATQAAGGRRACRLAYALVRAVGGGRGRGRRLRRAAVSASDRALPQSRLPRPLLRRLRHQPPHARRSVRNRRDSRACHRRLDRRLPRAQLRARGQGARSAGGDGRHLLQQEPHSPDGRAGQVGRLGSLHRNRRLGRPRGPHRSDQRRVRLDGGPPRPRVALAARHAGRRRRRSRNRRHLQHAHRRRPVRRRGAAARGQRAHPGARGAGHHHGDLSRALPVRQRAGVSGSGARPVGRRQRGAPAGQRPHRSAHGAGRGGVHSRPLRRRGSAASDGSRVTTICAMSPACSASA